MPALVAVAASAHATHSDAVSNAMRSAVVGASTATEQACDMAIASRDDKIAEVWDVANLQQTQKLIGHGAYLRMHWHGSKMAAPFQVHQPMALCAHSLQA